MKKDKIILIILLVFILIAGGIMLLFTLEKEEVNKEMSNSLKVKEEYSKLNDKINENNQRKYPIVSLTDDNPFVISNETEIIDILKNKMGIIYFGFSNDPWCRTLMPILAKVAVDTNTSKIYYLNIEHIREIIDLDDRNLPIVKEKGSKGYYEILKLMDDVLEPYYLLDKNGEKIDTGRKFLNAPTVVNVIDGKITKIHVGTVKTQKSGYDTLTKKEEKELYNALVELMKNETH